MAALLLPLLCLCSNAHAQQTAQPVKATTAAAGAYSIAIGGGMLSPTRITETGPANMQNKYGWYASAGIGYRHRIYKRLFAAAAIQVDNYNWKYRADLAPAVPGIQIRELKVNYAQSIFCIGLAVSARYDATISGRRFWADGGVKLMRIPSLRSGYSLGANDTFRTPHRFFFAEADFAGGIAPVYSLKIGTPLFSNTSHFGIAIAAQYQPTAYGTGTFAITNTTANSYGTTAFRATAFGVEVSYSLW